MANVRKDPATPGHRVGIVVPPDVLLLDVAVPLQVFAAWPRWGELARNPYRVTLHTPRGRAVTLPGLPRATTHGLAALAQADTIVVPGRARPQQPLSPVLTAELRRAARDGRRLMSICTGAFELAAAGVLDGRPAATHWQWAQQLAERHPRVAVDATRLYVDDGDVLTSAGILAGVDLCLHVVRRDLGAGIANALARFLVSPPHRTGGQAQFIEQPVPPADGGLGATREWMLANIAEPLTLERIARHASVSPRTLRRRFLAEVGASPIAWLGEQRLALARTLLEQTDLQVAEVARRAGFGTTQNLRAHFRRIVGAAPAAYRATFAHAA
jgi:transcriptional regulator GlxA family with amidase domain